MLNFFIASFQDVLMLDVFVYKAYLNHYILALHFMPALFIPLQDDVEMTSTDFKNIHKEGQLACMVPYFMAISLCVLLSFLKLFHVNFRS